MKRATATAALCQRAGWGLLVAALVGPPSAWSATDTNTFYGGRAVAVELTDNPTGPEFVLIGDTGELPVNGRRIQVIEPRTNVLNAVTLDGSRSVTAGVDDRANSQVTVTNLFLSFHSTNDVFHTLTVDFLSARASAICDPTGVVLRSFVQIEGLRLNDRVIPVTGKPNQIVRFSGGSLLLNAQSRDRSANAGAVSVAAILLSLNGSMQGTLGLAEADIVCPLPCERVRAMGAVFTSTPGGSGMFDLEATTEQGEHTGRLNFVDNRRRLRVVSTRPLSYTVLAGDRRRVVFDARINGLPGRATVVVVDRGAAATANDFFSIRLSNGYTASGNVRSSAIQLQPCPF